MNERYGWDIPIRYESAQWATKAHSHLFDAINAEQNETIFATYTVEDSSNTLGQPAVLDELMR